MKAVFDKLGLYDFLGFIIPGFLGILSIQILYKEIFKIPFPIKIDDGFINSVVFIAASYYFGVIMHEISEFIQEKLIKRIWGGLPSEKYLIKGDKTCSENEKESYYDLAQKVFQIKKGNYDKEKSHLVFNKFLAALQLAGKDERAQLFNTYYGMYRNFFTGSLMCFLAYFTYFINYLFNKFILNRIITDDFSFVVTGIVFLIFSLILLRKTRRCGETYVKYVFRGFAEYHRSTQNIKN